MKCNSAETKAINTDSLALVRQTDSLAAIIQPIDTAKLAEPAIGITEEDLANNEKYSSVMKPFNLYFRTNETSYITTDENQKFLSEAKTYLLTNKDKTLAIIGHSDSYGSVELNQKLSETRAASVKKQLTAEGFSAMQLLIEVKGETEPIASNETEEGRKANRRVSLAINQ
ncbi:MAG: OmpA family protein [Bacteroidota bacterium]